MDYRYCALIDQNDVVINVIVCSKVQWAIDNLGGNWIPVSIDNSVGINYTWDGQQFVAPVIEEHE